MGVRLEIVEIDGAPGIVLPRPALAHLRADAGDELDVTCEPNYGVLKRRDPGKPVNDNVLF